MNHPESALVTGGAGFSGSHLVEALLGEGLRVRVLDNLANGRVELLRLWGCLWTFTRVEGVEPTNNAAERALRHAVIWRRTSGGTDSETGSRFVERVLSAVATCRQRGIPVLRYLSECHEARRRGRPIPSLISAEIGGLAHHPIECPPGGCTR